MDRSQFFIVLALILIAIYFLCECNMESFAPLNYGTFYNNYPRGRCNRGSLKRSSCMVGNCPIGSPITDKESCDIYCAQVSDPDSQKSCMVGCLNMMKDCNEPYVEPI